MGTTGRSTRGEHEHHQRERSEVDRPAEAPVGVGVDEERDHEDQHADCGVQSLPRAGRAADVVLRDPVDRPEPVADDAREREHQHPVEPAQHAAEAERLHLSAIAQPARPGVDRLDRHQSEACWVVVAVFLKYCSKTRRAAGAAAVPPWPPFSITAQTAIVGWS